MGSESTRNTSFETDEGKRPLADLFQRALAAARLSFHVRARLQGGLSVLLGDRGRLQRIRRFTWRNHDVMLWAVSRAPLAKLQEYKKRMGWTFPWASSVGSDFNFDFNVSFTRSNSARASNTTTERESRVAAWTSCRARLRRADRSSRPACGTDADTYTRERPGVSAFALEDGVVYHTYSAYSRGVDALWGMYQWLDRAPKGRNEDGELRRQPPRRAWGNDEARMTNDEGAFKRLLRLAAVNVQRSTSNAQRRIPNEDRKSKDEGACQKTAAREASRTGGLAGLGVSEKLEAASGRRVYAKV